MVHFFVEELMEGVEVDGVLLGAYGCQISLGMNGNARVVTLVSVEWRHTGGGVRSIIVGELRKGQEFSPIVLLVVAVNPQILLQCLVHMLCLSVTFWVVT